MSEHQTEALSFEPGLFKMHFTAPEKCRSMRDVLPSGRRARLLPRWLLFLFSCEAHAIGAMPGQDRLGIHLIWILPRSLPPQCQMLGGTKPPCSAPFYAIIMGQILPGLYWKSAANTLTLTSVIDTTVTAKALTWLYSPAPPLFFSLQSSLFLYFLGNASHKRVTYCSNIP